MFGASNIISNRNESNKNALCPVYIVLAFKVFKYTFKSTHFEIAKQDCWKFLTMTTIYPLVSHVFFFLKDMQTFVFDTDSCKMPSLVYLQNPAMCVTLMVFTRNCSTQSLFLNLFFKISEQWRFENLLNMHAFEESFFFFLQLCLFSCSTHVCVKRAHTHSNIRRHLSSVKDAVIASA